MTIKALLYISFSLCALHASAQDRIYKKDGSEVQAIIKSRTEKEVTYKKFDNPDGPDYTISQRDIKSISYQDGRSYEVKKTAQKKYGNNILSLTPIAYLGDMNGESNQAGIGINYERILDKKGMISFVLPVFFALPTETSHGYVSAEGHQYSSYCIMPGLKYYPTGSRGIVKYAISASFYLMQGNEPDAYYNNATAGYYSTISSDRHYTVSGFMLGNSIVVHPMPHLYLEAILGFGFNYVDNRLLNNDVLNSATNPTAYFAMKAGYRF
jgi:hypothetical protein